MASPEKAAAAMGEDAPLAEVAAETGELVGHGTFQSPPGYGELDPVTSQGLHTVSWHQDAKTPKNPDFVAGYRKAYENADPAEDVEVMQVVLPRQDPPQARSHRGGRPERAVHAFRSPDPALRLDRHPGIPVTAALGNDQGRSEKDTRRRAPRGAQGS